MISRLACNAARTHVRRAVIARTSFRAPGRYGGRWMSSENITYSGGQATEGQGGYYGSGGSRKDLTPEAEHRPEMLALAADVQNIQAVMTEVETLEGLLESERDENNGEITGRSIELRSTIKKLMTSPEVMDCLSRLEIQGEPVWGLSSDERDLIKAAREKVNGC